MRNLFNYFRLIHMLNKANIHYAFYKIVQHIMDFVVQVQKEGKPMLTKIGVVDMSKEKIIGDFDMVSIWAAVGDANPIDRIEHLKAQNNELKKLLKEASEKIDSDSNKGFITNVNLVLKTFE